MHVLLQTNLEFPYGPKMFEVVLEDLEGLPSTTSAVHTSPIPPPLFIHVSTFDFPQKALLHVQ